MYDKSAQLDYHSDADAKRYHNRLGNPFLQPKEHALAARVTKHLPRDGKLLEVGCGEGSNLAYLARHAQGCSLTGVDFSEKKVVFMSHAVPGADAVCADATALPFGDEVFDVVYLRDLLHHVDFAREAVLDEAWRVLKPGGRIVIFESHGRRMLSRLFMLVNPVERGMRNSTPEQLQAMGRRLGPTRLQYVEGSFALRALGFFLGWPEGWRRVPTRLVYLMGAVWEKVHALLLPTEAGMYMMLDIRKMS